MLQPHCHSPLGRLAAVAAGLVTLLGSTVNAQDWPMWRANAGRTAAVADAELPEALQFQWAVDFGPRLPVWDDPLNKDLMPYDSLLEPIAAGGRIFVGLNDRDQVLALDADSGEVLWRYFTSGPVRFAPVAYRDRLLVASDDGYLHCISQADGELLWRFRGGPTAQKAIGNRRITSAWPARGGPVVVDDTVYFAASIWPFMGIFIYALDPMDGHIQWVNDGTGAQYIKQPHSAPAFAGVGPQGALVASGDYLLVPGGRSVPAAFDRRTGEFLYFEINAGGKGTGGSFVIADEQEFYVHTRLKGTRAFTIHDGVKTAFMPNEPVLHQGWVYSGQPESRDEERPGRQFVRAYRPDKELAWEIEADASGDLILVGSTLYAAGQSTISAIALPDGDAAEPKLLWQLPVPEPVGRLIAADGRLVAVSESGVLQVLGGGDPSQLSLRLEPGSPNWSVSASEATDGSAELADEVGRLLADGPQEGYALLFGGEQTEWVVALAQASPFEELLVVESDPHQVDRLRRRLDALGLYGRVSVHLSSPEQFMAPQYVAHRVMVSPAVTTQMSERPEMLATIYQSLRPYGGRMHLIGAEPSDPTWPGRIERLGLERADLQTAGGGHLSLTRVGSLPGAADWTHQHGDISNSVKSEDARVKLPLGVLWFGGNSHTDVLPRHGHGPSQQIVGGRLFIQGIDVLSARDVYTGRVLWRRQFDDLGTFDVYYDDTYSDTPLNPAYNQVHIPGANGRGTNFVVTEDRVYLIERNFCHILDPATGEGIGRIDLPHPDPENPKEWGYIGVYGDVLIGGIGFAEFRDRFEIELDELDERATGSKSGFGSKSIDRAGSRALCGFDRFTGELLWQIDSHHSFWHNGVVAGGGRLYCLDKSPEMIQQAMRRRGRAAEGQPRIVCLDPRTGQQQWEVTEGIFGTWLGYSKQHDVLLQAGAAGSDRLVVEVSEGMSVYRAGSGELLWSDPQRRYAGPCILHNDWIITNTNSYSTSAGAFHLLTGQPRMVRHPLTGQLQPWSFTRTYGCNKIIASENLLTFRSGAAGFYDLLTDSGTGNFGGFKSGCTSNLVVAGGVLNAPDYTRTCSCAYQNQTSLAMVHMPELELWTVHHVANNPAEWGHRVERLGINLGAPGNRVTEQGLIWLEYPTETGQDLPLQMFVSGETELFRSHALRTRARDLPWVQASGLIGLERLDINMELVEKPAEKKKKKSSDKDEAAEAAEVVEAVPPARGADALSELQPRLYQVRLLFGDVRGLEPGERVFDVWLQGERVAEDFDPALAVTDNDPAPLLSLPAVTIRQWLQLELVPKVGRPMLAGVEVQSVEALEQAKPAVSEPWTRSSAAVDEASLR